MPKRAGFPGRLQVDDASGTPRDISNDVTSVDFGTSRGLAEVTGLDKSAMERLLLLSDGKVSIKGVFNDTANMSHDVFKTVTSSGGVRTVTIDPAGTTTGSARLSMEILFSSYELSRGEDGTLTWTAEGQLADGTVPTWTTVP